MDEDFDPDLYKYPDIIVQRTEALVSLAAQVDETRDSKAKAHLLRAMERIVDRLSDPKDNVRDING